MADPATPVEQPAAPSVWKKRLLWIGISIVSILLLIFTLSKFNFRGKMIRYAPPPTPREVEAIHQQTEALIERAKVEATSDEQKKQVEEILKEPDIRVKLQKLADQLKDL